MSGDMGQTRQRILNEVALKHGVTLDDIRGRGRGANAVSARIEIAERLRSSEFRIAQISRILKRDHSTIHYYLNGITRPHRYDKRALPRVIQRLPRSLQDALINIARLGDVTPATLVAEWVSERVEHEVEARRRDALGGDTLHERQRAAGSSGMEAA